MKKITYIILGLLILQSCNREEFLDIKPKGVIIPSRVSDYRLLLDQQDRAAFVPGTEILSPGFIQGYSNTNLMTDDVFATSAGYIGTSENQFTFADDYYEETEEDPDWQNLYGQIYVCNIVLEQVMDATDGTEAEKLQLFAEALAHRAYAYFTLVNLYALHYDPATASNTPGVPFRLDSRLVGLEFPRQSVQAVYDLVLEDITEAIDLLPDTPELNFRPSKAGAYAFLARIYLYMGRFDEAREAADNSLMLYDTVLDYNEIPELFLGIINLPTNINDQQLVWMKGSNNPVAFLPVSPELGSLITANDQRRRLLAPFFIFGLPDAGQVYVSGQFRAFIPVGFSVPEVILTRAECNARLGNTSLALDDLNTLRQSRLDVGTFTPLTGTDADEILGLVKTERRLELMFNGLRLFDLKRYNVFDTEKTDIVHELNGTTFRLTANSNNWAIPIARKYILQNPEIGDNVRE